MYGSFFFQAEDGIRDIGVTGVQTCALPIWLTFSNHSLKLDNIWMVELPHDRSLRQEVIPILPAGSGLKKPNTKTFGCLLVSFAYKHFLAPIIYFENKILLQQPDRKSTRLNSSHANISYAVFCLKKKKNNKINAIHQSTIQIY